MKYNLSKSAYNTLTIGNKLESYLRECVDSDSGMVDKRTDLNSKVRLRSRKSMSTDSSYHYYIDFLNPTGGALSIPMTEFTQEEQEFITRVEEEREKAKEEGTRHNYKDALEYILVEKENTKRRK